MLPPADSQEALAQLFRQQRVATLDTLFSILRTSSRMSVFRRLSALGYLTSYSHTGRFYTQADIPDFDADGLWHYQGVLFSRHGSLKDSVEHLVDSSTMGRTHAELHLRLRLRVHNALLALLHDHRIGRMVMDSLYLYVSADPRAAALQLAERKQQQQTSPPTPPAETSSALTIEVLLEVIHAATVVPDPTLVSRRLAARSVPASLDQIEAIFRTYGLKKTPASP